MASTWYVSPGLGSNGNSGTSRDFPWLTLAYAALNCASGDTVVLINSGSAFGWTAEDRFVKTCNNLTLIAESSTPVPVTSGRLITGWTLDTGTTYYHPIGTGKVVNGVIREWGLRVDGSGRLTSDISTAASLAACRLAGNSYFYQDSGAGNLYCNFNGTDPNTDIDFIAYPVQWIEAGPTSLISLTGNNNLIEGVRCENQRNPLADNYGIVCYGDGNVVQGCSTYYHTWHGIVLAGSGGLTNRNNTVRQNQCWGGGGVNTRAGSPVGDAILIASYADNGTNITGCRLRSNTIHCFAPLLVDGTPANSETCDAFYHHCGAATYVQDIEYRDNRVTHYENQGQAFTGGDTLVSAIPADNSAAELVHSNYPVRYYDNQHRGGFSNALIHGAAHVRGLFSLPGEMTTGNGNFSLPASTVRTLFDACHISVNLKSASGYRSVFELSRSAASASYVNLLNTTVLDNSPSTPNWNRFATFNILDGLGSNNAGRVRAYGSVIASLHAKALTLFYGDSAMSTSLFAFTGNHYYNIEDGGGGYWSEDATRRTKLLWKGIDPENPAVYDSLPGFTAPITDPTPSASSVLRINKVLQTNHARYGINNRRYNGRFGAWQDGSLSEPLLLLA